MASKEQGLRIGQVNLARSRNATITYLNSQELTNLDVVLVQEPYCAKTGTRETYAIPGLGRVQCVADGSTKFRACVLIVSPHLNGLMLTQYCTTDAVAVRLSYGSFQFAVASLYCPPQGDIGISIDYLNELLGALPGETLLIGADLNAKSDLWFSGREDRRGAL